MVARKVSILGSTGSVGQNMLRLIEEGHEVDILALTAQENVHLLIEQAKKFSPEIIAIGDGVHMPLLKEALGDRKIKILSGREGICEAAGAGADLVLAAIVGTAGLAPTLAAIQAGSSIALANKECLVSAGDLFLRQAKRHNANIIPVDSEHNAIFQLLGDRPLTEIKEVVLTASGGPFRELSIEQMAKVTPEMALNHPIWSMGRKICIDSATLMNKGLELIEGYHLFPLQFGQFQVVIHPQSFIHALIHFCDGTSMAHLGPPDMCTPLAHALGYPARIAREEKPFSLTEMADLQFYPLDTKRFPAVSVALHALQNAGHAPTLLNAANEVAVYAFLDGKIKFLDIVPLVEKVIEKGMMKREAGKTPETLEQVLEIDKEARINAELLIKQNK